MTGPKKEDTFLARSAGWDRDPDGILGPITRASEFPYDKPAMYGRDGTEGPDNSIWEILGSELGDGMGDGGADPFSLELDALKDQFRQTFADSLPAVGQMSAQSLFSLLADADPEFVAQVFAPEDESEMIDIYTLWAIHSCGEEQDDEAYDD